MTIGQHLTSPYAFVFPGQGSQKVGMASDLAAASPVAADVIARANDLLGIDLGSLMATGPDEDLADTYNSQPAIFTASVAALRALEHEASNEGIVLKPAMVAGHSLGEFTALVAADVVDFDTGLQLVRERGRVMKEAGDAAPGAMAAILGMDDDRLAELVREAAGDDVLTIANLNCPGQTVISGEVAPMERFMEIAKDAGARRITRLPISIASHSSLMASAAEKLNAVLDDTELREPRMPVISNATALPLATAKDIREELRTHVERGVNWTGTIQTMTSAGIATFVEIGPGNVLAGLNRRIEKSTSTLALADLGLINA